MVSDRLFPNNQLGFTLAIQASSSSIYSTMEFQKSRYMDALEKRYVTWRGKTLFLKKRMPF